jgi:hypothetical protein
MQGAVDIPRLDALTLAEFAGGGEVSVFTLEGEGGQGREPVKPLGRIGDERKHPLSGSNDHELSIRAFFDERKCTSTARLVWLERGSKFGGNRMGTRCRSLGHGCSDGKRGCSNGSTHVPVELLFVYQCQS